jgi:alpha-tubulin suppressor-like RCC1 family protein
MLQVMSVAVRLCVRLTIVSFLSIVLPAIAAAQPSTVAGGGAFTLVVKSDGTVWAFGLNNNGQIGDNTLTTRKTPQQVAVLSSIQAVAAGGVHAMALKSTGACMCGATTSMAKSAMRVRRIARRRCS